MQVEACEYQSLMLQVGDPQLLQLPSLPDAGRVAFLRERDFDLKLQLAAGISDSSPAPSSAEPVWLSPSPEPAVSLRVLGLAQGQTIELELGCPRPPDHPEFEVGRALQSLALLSAEFRRQRSIELARRFSWALWRLRLQTEDRRIEQWIDLQLGYVVRYAGFMDLAERQLQLFLEQPDYQPAFKALVRFSLAQNSLQRGDATAQGLMEQSVHELKQAGYRTAASWAFHDICILRRLNSDPGSVDCLSEAAQRFAEAGMPRDQGNALLNRFTALSRFGRYQEARETLKQAELLIAPSGDQERIARLALLRSVAAKWRGDSEAALRELAEAESLYQELDARGDVANTQSLIGHAYSLAGDDARALTWYTRAERNLALSSADSRLRTNLLSQAHALHRLERHQEALDALERLADQRHLSSDDFSGNWALDRAEILLALQRPEQARQQLDGIADDQLTPPQQTRRLRIEVRLGADASTQMKLLDVLREDIRLGRWVSAVDHAEALLCCANADGVRAENILDQTAQQLLDQLSLGIEQLRSPGLRHALIRSAQEIALLRHRRTAPADAALPELISTLSRLRQLALQPPNQGQGDQLDALEEAVADAWLGGAVSATDDRHLAWVAQAPTAAPRELDRLPPVSLALQPDDVLIYPVLGRQTAVLLWQNAGAAGQWRSRPLPDPADIRRSANRLLELLSAGHAAEDSIEPLAASLSASFDWQAITRNARRILVLIDSQTASIPFNLFDQLDQQRPIVLLQSMRPSSPPSFQELRLIAAAQSAGNQALLVQAGKELDEVAEAWPRLGLQRRDHADLAGISAALATPHSLLHIAAHGSGARRVEEDSGLWLSSSETSSAFLSSVRVRRFPLACEAVVLSACESGYSRASGSLGMAGLAGALVDGGAKLVVGSRWAVSDRAARVFSVALHQAWAKQPDQVHLALLQAQQAVRAQRGFRHPSHWAGWFVLQRGPVPADIAAATASVD